MARWVPGRSRGLLLDAFSDPFSTQKSQWSCGVSLPDPLGNKADNVPPVNSRFCQNSQSKRRTHGEAAGISPKGRTLQRLRPD